ncbi:hypothetical protein [Streptomyces sp. NBC_00102]|uniref:hypothetical protein n=1 Tax=Streptomyces sp. NBC_00102 TaxID=2975652 RepID=UPI0022576793|nr:hypothetical protein [Streptomyces sp. NBC_00102]MCX5400383.1 hypothetical protein [Streptomyces sp. NBC_00102]
MEQSIDSNTKPEFAAGTDPAYIPGLTAPVPVRTGTEDDEESAAPAEASDATDSDAGVTDVSEDTADGVQDAVPAELSGASDAPEEAVVEKSDKTSGDDSDKTSDDESAADHSVADDDADESGAPVFEISDRRGSIRVDKSGIRFTLDDQQADFEWSEVSAVEVKTARTARRFTLTVHVSSRRWFNGEVVAESRKRLKEWPEELDVVLDAYFEES